MKQNRGIQRFSIFVAILALVVLSCASVADIPNPFATATPTATATFTPSSTPSPTPTRTSTPTPSPTGRLKEEQPNGTTLFTDYDGGYQMTFLQDWTVVILEKDNINEILDSLPEQEQNVSDLIEFAKNADTNGIIRVFGFNFKAQQNAYTPNINVSYDTDPILSAISLEDLINVNTEYLPSIGMEVIDSGLQKTSSGVETGFMDIAWTLKVSSNQSVDVQQKQVYFKSGDGMVVITFSMLKDTEVDLNGDIERLIESIQLLDK